MHPMHTLPVGLFKPNAFGLYGMLGNVSQWAEDVSHDNYEGAPANGSAWIANGNPWFGKDLSAHIVRGGSWDSNPTRLRAASLVSRGISSRGPCDSAVSPANDPDFIICARISAIGVAVAIALAVVFPDAMPAPATLGN
jgi:Sulfatase-modifying factor enzyme 1